MGDSVISVITIRPISVSAQLKAEMVSKSERMPYMLDARSIEVFKNFKQFYKSIACVAGWPTLMLNMQRPTIFNVGVH